MPRLDAAGCGFRDPSAGLNSCASNTRLRIPSLVPAALGNQVPAGDLHSPFRHLETDSVLMCERARFTASNGLLLGAVVGNQEGTGTLSGFLFLMGASDSTCPVIVQPRVSQGVFRYKMAHFMGEVRESPLRRMRRAENHGMAGAVHSLAAIAMPTWSPQILLDRAARLWGPRHADRTDGGRRRGDSEDFLHIGGGCREIGGRSGQSAVGR